MSENRYVPCGLLLDGYEYIPEDVYQAHLPVAFPPGTKVQRLFTQADDEVTA